MANINKTCFEYSKVMLTKRQQGNWVNYEMVEMQCLETDWAFSHLTVLKRITDGSTYKTEDLQVCRSQGLWFNFKRLLYNVHYQNLDNIF